MNFTKAFMALLLGTVLVACGGGGSGSNDTGSLQASLKYSGNTNQATVNSANAPMLATKSLSAQDDVMASGNGARTLGSKNAIDIARQFALNIGSTSTRATTTRDTQPGSCGGAVTTTPGASSSTSFSGTISFSAYCDGFTGAAGPSITLNGTVVFSGTMATDSVGTQYISSLTMSFIDVSATQQPGADTFVLAGSVSFALSPSSMPLTMTVSMVVQDSSGKTLWLENYKIDEATSPGQLYVSGRLYHPDYGYVTITTTQPLTMSGKWPTSGTIVIDGAGGTRACLVALSSLQYRVDMDNDRNGTCETLGTATNWPLN